MDVSRRAFIAAGLAAAGVLCGCSATKQEASETDSTPAPAPTPTEPEQIEFGDSIDFGSVIITVENIERDLEEEAKYIEFGAIDAGTNLLILTGLCENVSYADYTGDMVCLDDFMHLEDADGVTIKPRDSMYGYDPYSVAAGSLFECPIGEKVRFAMAYEVPVGTDAVTVIVGDFAIPATPQAS